MQTAVNYKPIGDWVFIDLYDDGETVTKMGDYNWIWIGDDKFGSEDLVQGRDYDNTHRGIRPRWGLVVGVSDKAAEDVQVGQKVLCDQMKWTRGFQYDRDSNAKLWAIKAEDILMVDETGLTDDEVDMLERKYSFLE